MNCMEAKRGHCCGWEMPPWTAYGLSSLEENNEGGIQIQLQFTYTQFPPSLAECERKSSWRTGAQSPHLLGTCAGTDNTADEQKTQGGERRTKTFQWSKAEVLFCTTWLHGERIKRTEAVRSGKKCKSQICCFQTSRPWTDHAMFKPQFPYRVRWWWSTWEADADRSQFEASRVYRMSFRTVGKTAEKPYLTKEKKISINKTEMKKWTVIASQRSYKAHTRSSVLTLNTGSDTWKGLIWLMPANITVRLTVGTTRNEVDKG